MSGQFLQGSVGRERAEGESRVPRQDAAQWEEGGSPGGRLGQWKGSGGPGGGRWVSGREVEAQVGGWVSEVGGGGPGVMLGHWEGGGGPGGRQLSERGGPGERLGQWERGGGSGGGWVSGLRQWWGEVEAQVGCWVIRREVEVQVGGWVRVSGRGRGKPR